MGSFECIPNFSEGRNQAVIDGLAATANIFQVSLY